MRSFREEILSARFETGRAGVVFDLIVACVWSYDSCPPCVPRAIQNCMID